MARIGFIILAATIPLFASDTIMLRDGSQRIGTFIGASDRTVTFEENGARRQYDLSQIRSVQFDPSLAFRNSSRTREYADRGPAQNVEPSGRMIPAGAELVVRTNQDIRSTTAEPNRYYSAVVERDVIDGSGQMVVPRGSEAQLVIRDVPAGSSHQLTLDLQSVSVNGSTYYVSTEDLQRSGRRAGEEHGDHLVGRRRADHGRRLPAPAASPIGLVGRAQVRIGQDVAGSHRGPQRFEERFVATHGRTCCHANGRCRPAPRLDR